MNIKEYEAAPILNNHEKEGNGKEVLNSKTDEFSHRDNFERAFLSNEVISRIKKILSEPNTNQATPISKRSSNVTTSKFSVRKIENSSILVYQNKISLSSVKTEKHNGNNNIFYRFCKEMNCEIPEGFKND